MAGLIFFYESQQVDILSGRREETLDLWNYAAKIGGGIDKMIAINLTPDLIRSPDRSIDFLEINYVNAIDAGGHINEIDGDKAIFILPWDAPQFSIVEPMIEHAHNRDWYVFGPAAGWNSVHPKPAGEAVYIPQNGLGATHSIMAATAVMFDRYQKLS